MNADVFQSNGLSLALSWFFCLPFLLACIQLISTSFKKHEGLPWIYSVWIGLCFLLLSPARYLAFLVVLGASYPFQNLASFFTLIIVWRWIPAAIALVLLTAIGLQIPFYLTLWLATLEKFPRRSGLVVSALMAPIAAFLGTVVFSFLLPFAAISAHILDADALIKATNGPAHIVFLCESGGMIALPPYFSETPQTSTDRIRSHIAFLYLSNKNHDEFLRVEYPYLYGKYSKLVLKL